MVAKTAAKTEKRATKTKAEKPVKKAVAKPVKAIAKAKPMKAERENAAEFAVIETGGKQYVVSKGDVITIEKLSDDLKEGDTVTFDKVLLVDNGTDTTIGTPYIKEAKVIGTLAQQGKGKKIDVIKYKAKVRYAKRYGHRQPYMKIKIEEVK